MLKLLLLCVLTLPLPTLAAKKKPEVAKVPKVTAPKILDEADPALTGLDKTLSEARVGNESDFHEDLKISLQNNGEEPADLAKFPLAPEPEEAGTAP